MKIKINTTMEAVACELESVINHYYPVLQSANEMLYSHKQSPGKWSKKEILGHLIDSAQSNIRRFVVTQYEENPTIVYKQDAWVEICVYRNWNTAHLIQLWYLLNLQICRILEHTSPDMAQRTCRTEDLHTLEWLALDYIKHLKHHLHQVLDMEPFPY